MTYNRIIFKEYGVTVELSDFNLHGKTREVHAILHVEPRGELFPAQYDRICSAEQALLAQPQYSGLQILFKRCFLSDAANQPVPHDSHISLIQQAPLDGSKVAVWLYLASDMNVEDRDGLVEASHNGYRHLWMLAAPPSPTTAYAPGSSSATWIPSMQAWCVPVARTSYSRGSPSRRII